MAKKHKNLKNIKIQWDGENGALMTLNKHYSDGNNYAQPRSASTIVLMEVAG